MDAVERVERVLQRAQDQLNYADKVQAREAALDRDDLRTLLSLARSNGWQDIDPIVSVLGCYPCRASDDCDLDILRRREVARAILDRLRGSEDV